jgi:hypothetical protein
MHDQCGPSVKSRLTFLIYLNDDFEGGTTTFFMPPEQSRASHGDAKVAEASTQLRRHRVKPVTGSALCFPQSSIASLLHEGSPVIHGTKYVIRTDVMFKMNGDEPARP